jgi:hypothetical protein
MAKSEEKGATQQQRTMDVNNGSNNTTVKNIGGSEDDNGNLERMMDN